MPQNVEAEDKLIGPFGFRQFIYLLICAGLIGLAILIGRAATEAGIVVGIIVSPVVIFLLILALPLRQDQPMETYVAALIRYHLYPRLKIWDPDGTDGTIEITVPKKDEEVRTKSFGAEEAESRLKFLSSVVDTEGNAMREDVYNTAVATVDMLDFDTAMTNKVSRMMDAKEAERQEEIRNVMRAGARMNEAQNIKSAVAGAEARAERAEMELARMRAEQTVPMETPEIKLDSNGGAAVATSDDSGAGTDGVGDGAVITDDSASVLPAEPVIIDPSLARLAFEDHKSVETVAKEANEVYVKLR